MKANFLISLSLLLLSYGFSLKVLDAPIPVLRMVDCTELACFEEILSDDFRQFDSTQTPYQVNHNYYPQSEFVKGELKEFPENRLTFGTSKDQSTSTVKLNTEHKALFDSTLETFLKQGYHKTSSTDFGFLLEEIYSSKEDLKLTISTRVYEGLTMEDDLKFNISLMRVH